MPKYTLLAQKYHADEPEEIDLTATDIARLTVLVEKYMERLRETPENHIAASDYEALLEKLKRCF